MTQRNLQQALDPRSTLRLFGAVRIGAGAGMLAGPTLFGRALGLDRDTADRTRWLTAMVAAREVALGVDALTGLRRPGGVRSSYLAQLISDAGDAMATARAIRAGHVRRAVGAALVAFAVGGVLAEAIQIARAGD